MTNAKYKSYVISFYKAYYSKMLLGLLGDEELIDKWWCSPNLAFDGRKPLEQLQLDHEAVGRYLMQNLNGGYY